MCKRNEKEFGSTIGLPRHRHFEGFFSVSRPSIDTGPSLFRVIPIKRANKCSNNNDNNKDDDDHCEGLMTNYRTLCPFDYTAFAVSENVGITETRLITPVRWLSLL